MAQPRLVVTGQREQDTRHRPDFTTSSKYFGDGALGQLLPPARELVAAAHVLLLRLQQLLARRKPLLAGSNPVRSLALPLGV